MILFKSVIVFDTETSSLPEKDHNTTKITELVFLGCEVEHLKHSEGLPRVLHKLVLLFNPFKAIHPEATDISGLFNESLENLKPFREEDVEILKLFINRLPQPVCIVAHNGDKFDFPILKRALKKVNKNLQNNVYCADSIKAFQSILPNAKKPFWNRSILNRTHNEVTPSHQRTQPVNFLQFKQVSRNLFPSKDAFDDEELSQKDGEAQVISYELNHLYYFFFGSYFLNAHRAEEDSKALLSCIAKCDGFLEWMNKNAVIFNSIEPLF